MLMDIGRITFYRVCIIFELYTLYHIWSIGLALLLVLPILSIVVTGFVFTVFLIAIIIWCGCVMIQLILLMILLYFVLDIFVLQNGSVLHCWVLIKLFYLLFIVIFYPILLSLFSRTLEPPPVTHIIMVWYG